MRNTDKAYFCFSRFHRARLSECSSLQVEIYLASLVSLLGLKVFGFVNLKFSF